MFELTLERQGYYFHIVVRVRTETFSLIHEIIIDYPQNTKMHSVAIVIIGKTECMITFEPSVIGKAAATCSMINCFHFFFFVIFKIFSMQR
jgi:hypothetical protein